MSCVCDKKTYFLHDLMTNGKCCEIVDKMITLKNGFPIRDEICRQEFQYAKKTAKKPVIPVVVGSGSFDWMMTVVGLLIAGEIYIHFRNKEVQEAKMTELLKAVKKSVPEVKVSGDIGSVQGEFYMKTKNVNCFIIIGLIQ